MGPPPVTYAVRPSAIKRKALNCGRLGHSSCAVSVGHGFPLKEERHGIEVLAGVLPQLEIRARAAIPVLALADGVPAVEGLRRDREAIGRALDARGSGDFESSLLPCVHVLTPVRYLPRSIYLDGACQSIPQCIYFGVMIGGRGWARSAARRTRTLAWSPSLCLAVGVDAVTNGCQRSRAARPSVHPASRRGGISQSSGSARNEGESACPATPQWMPESRGHDGSRRFCCQARRQLRPTRAGVIHVLSDVNGDAATIDRANHDRPTARVAGHTRLLLLCRAPAS